MHAKPSMCLDVKAMSKIASGWSSCTVTGCYERAFRPEDSVCRLRTLQRHRKNLVESAAMWIQHMQKALNEMNLHLHHVLSDISGRSGLAILDAILAGERDPKKLASLADRRVEKSQAQIEAALTGDYRPELLFVLSQSLDNYRQMQEQIAQCDLSIEKQLAKMADCKNPNQSSDNTTIARFGELQATQEKAQRCFGIKLGRASQAHPRSRSDNHPWIERSSDLDSGKR